MGARLDTALIEAVAEAAAPRLHEFAPRELSGLAWACARAQHAPPRLLDTLAAAVKARRDAPASKRARTG